MSGSTSTERQKVLVLGAGIVGVSTALRLQQRGFDVELLDRGLPGDGTSFGNAGILAACSIIPVTVPGLLGKVPGMLTDKLGPLYVRWSYLPRMVPWLLRYLKQCTPERNQYIAAEMAKLTGNSLDEHLRLARGTPAEKRIHKIPYAFVYPDRSAFDGDASAWQIRKQHGFSWEVIEGNEVREAEPELASRYQCMAIASEQHGVIDEPGEYVKDLARVFADAGGRVTTADVDRLEVRDGAVRGVKLANGETVSAANVVLAAGAWSGRLLKTIGVTVPLETERGYHVEFHGASIQPNHALMITDGKFVVTPMSNRVRLAGLVEFGGLDAPPSKAPVETLMARLRQVLPNIDYESHTQWLGHRPAPSDSLPLLGELASAKGLHLAFGHHHVGLTSGPKTGRLIADTIAGDQANIDLTAFSADRFGG